MFEIGSLTHILLLIPIPFFYYVGMRVKEKRKELFYTSLFLLCMEILKQIYYIQAQIWTIWIIPFQLCSIPLYYCFFIHSKYIDAFESFIENYIFIAAIFALLYPQDMIHNELLLTVHAFLWHYLLIFMSAIAYDKKKGFLSGSLVFLICCGIATVFNILLNKYGTINLFYINPLIVTSQPIFSYIGIHFGVIVQNVIYILSIILASYLLRYKPFHRTN